MKTLVTGLTLIALAILNGCTRDGTQGGPGMTAHALDENLADGQTENTFSLTVPLFSSSLRQGQQVEATVGITRNKNFDEDVSLSFSRLPQGVKVEPTSPMIKRGDTNAKVTFTASDVALPGGYDVEVTGRPTKGTSSRVDFGLNILAKDSFTLSLPLLSTSIQQGETITVAIGISRDKSFDKDVMLRYGKAPTGVTIEPAEPIIKRGGTESPITFTTADDAALGDFAIAVTGYPTKGANASGEFKLTVTAK